jgi:hypothetical protein
VAHTLHLNQHRRICSGHVGKLEQHPRYQALLKRFEIDAAWCDELLKIANDLSAIPALRATRRRLLISQRAATRNSRTLHTSRQLVGRRRPEHRPPPMGPDARSVEHVSTD